MARIAMTRTIFADPTSAALLLASASLVEGQCSGLTVEVRRPSRTRTAFVSRVVVTRGGLRAASGSLTLSRGARAAGSARTVAVLRLEHATDVAADGAISSMLRSVADELLTTIATLAEDRAFAA